MKILETLAKYEMIRKEMMTSRKQIYDRPENAAHKQLLLELLGIADKVGW